MKTDVEISLETGLSGITNEKILLLNITHCNCVLRVMLPVRLWRTRMTTFLIEK